MTVKIKTFRMLYELNLCMVLHRLGVAGLQDVEIR
jgi:hypothetical protein